MMYFIYFMICIILLFSLLETLFNYKKKDRVFKHRRYQYSNHKVIVVKEYYDSPIRAFTSYLKDNLKFILALIIPTIIVKLIG